MADAPEFKQPPNHVPVDPPNVVAEPVPYPKPHVHTSDFVEPVGHNPTKVVGDTLDEVPQPPPLSVPNPPFVPADVPLPDPHVPGGVIGDELAEVPQPPPLGVPNPPFEPQQPTGLTVPAAPFDPSQVATPEPHTPVDPWTPLLPDPEPPSAPPPIPSEYVEQREGRVHVPASVNEILESVASLDRRLAAFLGGVGDPENGIVGAYDSTVERFTGAPGSRVWDPVMHARIMKDYIASVGVVGAAGFTALQTALHAMNSKYGRVFNPFYLASSVIPSEAKVALDTDEKVHERFVNTVEDPAYMARIGRNEGEVSKLESENFYSPDYPYEEGTALPMGAFVDLALRDISDPAAAAEMKKITFRQEYPGGLRRRQVDMSSMFSSNGKVLPRHAAGTRVKVRENDVLAASSFNWKGSKGAIPAAFNVEDELYGNVLEQIDDDLAYVPLMLQDLRPGPDGELRRVYFRALNLQTGETFTPNWNEEEAFGRVDPILGYRSTGRSISVSFAVHAFTPEDLPVIHKKRSWLASMVYPEVSDDMLMRAGPVCRLRVGDLYNNSRGGLAGVIKSLEMDDSEQVWELKRGYKVPHGFNVTLTFQVLHEGTPGINNGHFTVVQSSVPRRSVDDPSRTDPIRTDTDDSLFSSIRPSRRPRPGYPPTIIDIKNNKDGS